MNTSQEVIDRTGVSSLADYFEPGPMTDCSGFFVQRFYPAGSDLARVVARNGDQVLSCLIQFIVRPPRTPGGTSRVVLHARMYDRYRRLIHLWPPFGEQFDLDDPRAPTPDSLALFRRTRHPVDLDEIDFDLGEHLYEGREGVFLDGEGRRVTPQQMLDHAYECHCRTYGRTFSWRWRVGTWSRHAVRGVVWRGQDAFLWVLLSFYDIDLVGGRDQVKLDPFHKYKPADFRRVTEKSESRSNFFGFESSRKSFFTNLTVLAICCAALYWTGPRTGLVRAIYNNTALTTAALVFAFLLADLAGPWLLTRSICTLSRLRPLVLFFVRRVRR